MPKIPLKDTGHKDQPRRAERTTKEKRYNTRRWRRLRALHLAEEPTCRECGQLATDVDHITPVRLGGSFWGGPFQSLCKSCHARKSAHEARYH